MQLGQAKSLFYIRESSAFTGQFRCSAEVNLKGPLCLNYSPPATAGMNKETLEYVMILLELDGDSKSANDAPSVGSLGPPGVKLTGQNAPLTTLSLVHGSP